MSVSTASLIEITKAQLDKDIATRISNHQVAIAEERSAPASPIKPLNLLAIGDSWFDYPLDGELFGIHTDVPACLTQKAHVLNLAHYGYTSTQEMGYARQQLIRKALTTPENGKFDAILISAGGNDIAGDALCIWLNEASLVGNDMTRAINMTRFFSMLNTIRASYYDLFAIRDELLPGAPIFGHSYDSVWVTGKGVCTLGPWLKPSLDYCGWTDPKVAGMIMDDMLGQFAAVLDTLMLSQPNLFVHVRTQGTLSPDQWANELHPTPVGFRLIAQKFINVLAVAFPGRIS